MSRNWIVGIGLAALMWGTAGCSGHAQRPPQTNPPVQGGPGPQPGPLPPGGQTVLQPSPAPGVGAAPVAAGTPEDPYLRPASCAALTELREKVQQLHWMVDGLQGPQPAPARPEVAAASPGCGDFDEIHRSLDELKAKLATLRQGPPGSPAAGGAAANGTERGATPKRKQ